MTAHELARLLLAGPDLPVYVRGYEDGIDDITSATQITVVRDVHDAWYYGDHAIEAPDEDGDLYFSGQHRFPDKGASLPRTQGVLLAGKSGTES